jgi:hypothetical protein
MATPGVLPRGLATRSVVVALRAGLIKAVCRCRHGYAQTWPRYAASPLARVIEAVSE